MPRPKRRDAELRARILVEARRLLDSEGTAGVTARAVARAASTSPPAVYELFGDKQGLVRALFFEGFHELRGAFDALEPTSDPAADLHRSMRAFRAFALANPAMIHLMFGRAFSEFEPGPDDLAAGAGVRRHLVGRVQRCVDAGLLEGDAADLAHVLLATAQGLALQENAGWLGTTEASRARRWEVATRVVLGA